MSNLVLNLISHGQMLIEIVDDLADTHIYKRDIKRAANNLQQILIKHNNFVFKGVKHDTMDAVVKSLDFDIKLFTKIASMSVDQKIHLKQIIDAVDSGDLIQVDPKKFEEVKNG